jgi:dolichol-phosphate mannosyltransferase
LCAYEADVNPLVIVPTYNERENIAELLDGVLRHLPVADVLVVDDGSPDGTGDIVAERAREDRRVKLLRRSGKAGLGTAYIAGFHWALQRDYAAIIGMDADFSHDPKYLPRFVDEIVENDLVIGSRYVPGGATPDWKLSRRIISRIGNGVARTVLGLPVRDCTTGYKCYRREALASIDLDGIDLVGYGFLIETTYQCFLNGLRIKEIPIVFIDRREGKSKMTGTIVSEALGYVFRRRWQRVRQQLVWRRNAES